MSGTAGNDTFNNVSDKVTVDGAAGNDSITSYGENVSIFGGTGNDTIVSTTTRGILYPYAAGDGNDIIQGFSGNDTLQIIGGSYTTSVSGNDFIVSVGNGSIILKNAVKDKWSKIRLANSAGKVSVWNDWNIMSGTAGNDTITVKGRTTVFGGAGNYYIYDDYSNTFNTIYGGDGNDTITNDRGYYSTIDGGDGDDRITVKGRTTVFGGAGSDLITISGPATATT